MVFKTVFSILTIALICNIVRCDSLVINQLVDTVIKEVVKKIEKNVAIPHLEKVYHLGFLELGLNATNGEFSDLSTLKRTADATMNLGEEAITVFVPLSLGSMKMEFRDCQVWLDDSSVADTLTVTIGKNAIAAEISIVSKDESCQVVVNSAEVTLLDDIDIVMAKLGEEEVVAEELINWTIEHFNSKVRASVESKLKAALTTEVQKVNLCQYI